MSNDLVSAIIPAYGRVKPTQRAIDSVNNQTYSEIELIVIDDGSNVPLSNKLKLPTDSIVSSKLVRFEDNQGANVARNAGINNARGKYVAFLDSDDEWLPEKIDRQMNALNKSDSQASYTSVKQVDSDGCINTISRAKYDGDLRSVLLNGNIIGTFSSVIIKTKTISNIGFPNPELPSWQDWEWYLRLSSTVQFAAVDEPLVIRHNEGDQISRDFNPKKNISYPALRDQLIELSQTPQEKKESIAHLNYHLGYSALVNKNYSEARSLFASSILKKPSNFDSYKYFLLSGKYYPVARQLKRKVLRTIYT